MATTTDFGAALTAAAQGGYIAQLSGGTYTITQPIIININSTTQGIGINGGGATLISQVPAGQPVIEFVVGPGVDLRYLDLSNFTIQGNGSEGDGIKIVADGNDRWVYNWNINNVTVNHVGGYGLDVQGSVFEGLVSNSWMNNNGLGGALFEHSAGGGQASALRWFGGGFENNGGAGLTLANGARDMSVDGATFINNNGPGISAMSGITSVTGSDFENNHGAGVNFQVYGNFNDNTFSSTGAQTVGINGYLAGDATLIGDSSTGAGLANLQGNGAVLAIGDSGSIATGSGVAVAGLGGDDHASVTVSTLGVTAPTLTAISAATTAAVANSTGTGALETALKAALAGDTVAHLTATTYTVTSPIIINLTASMSGPLGIDLGGAKITSQIANGGPVIEIIAGPGVNVSNLTLSNFTIQGNGAEGDGIKIVADGTDRSITNLQLTNVNVEHVGGIGLDVIGNVSHATVLDSWMHGNSLGGARFADSAGGGVASGLQWIGGGFRKNGGAGLILDNGAHDMTVKGAYFVENYGPGLDATSGITLVQESGFENNQGAGAMVGGSGGSFTDDTFSTYGPQGTAVAGHLTGGQVNMTGTDAEYYGGGSDPTVVANLQGTGTLAIAGGGKVVVGPSVTVTGANPVVAGPTAPAIMSITAAAAGLTAGTGDLNAGKVVTLTAAFSEAVTVAGGAPSMLLNDGGTAIYTGGSGSSALTFSYTVQAGQNAADLGVASISLNGATIKDSGAIIADLSAATNYNPSGTLQIDTTAPTVTSIAASGAGITAGSGLLGIGKVVTLTVNMSEAVTVTGTPTLTLNDGGTATYTGGSGSSALTFSYTVGTGQNTSDLVVSNLNLGSGSIVDGAGNAANLAGAVNYNPAGTLQISTAAPVLTETLANDTGISTSDRITSNPALAGTADPNAVVHFTVDGAAAAATATANASGAWSYTPTGLADGVHTVVASETNVVGSTGTASLSFTLDRAAPVVTEQFVSGTGTAAATLTGTGDANAVVHFTVDGSAIAGAATADSSGAWSYSTAGLANGTHTVVASETDAAGNTGTASLNFTLGTTPGAAGAGGTAPVVTEGLANDTGASSTDSITSDPTLKGTADANAVVHFTVDGAAIAATATADSNGSWSYTPTGLADGAHSVVASETNAAGGTGTASLAFTLDTHAPTTVLTGDVVTNGQVTLTGTTGEAGDTVSIYDGYSWLGFATTGSDGSFSFTASAPSNVSHTYGAYAMDLAGNIGPGSNHLTPGTAMPSLTVSLLNDTGASPTDNITSNPTLKGTADANAVVHFTVDGSAITATATADSTGAWSYSPTGLGDGSHTVVASETNAAGSTGAAALSFTLDAHSPALIFTAGVTANGQVTVFGTTGEAGDVVSIYDGYNWLGFATTGSDGRFSFTASAASTVVNSYGANAVDTSGHEGHGLNKLIIGSTAADSLVGTSGSDVIVGNGGNDRITGGAGADTLTGGSGQATFAYNVVTDSTAAASDTITDFRPGSDKIDFTAILGINATNGVPTFQGNITGTGSLTLNAHSVAYLEVGATTQILVNTTSTAETVSTSDMHAADMKIGLLGVHLGLSATDFHHA